MPRRDCRRGVPAGVFTAWIASSLPELPEVEQVKRSLEPHVIGARVARVKVSRRDVIHSATRMTARKLHAALLQGDVIAQLQRHGKNLAIIGESGRVICVHLGMSGHLQFAARGDKLKSTTHVHCVWDIETNRCTGRLIFRDPRRFGGLWLFESWAQLREARWIALGPDAITMNERELFERLRFRQRPVKSALLDQSTIAGVGNIYADEALFRAGIHPCSICQAIPELHVRNLAGAIRKVLQEAIDAGGSTIRTYLDGLGTSGRFAGQLRVYGRGGQPCMTCGKRLGVTTVAQRTTVFCSRCQRKFR